MAIVLCVAALGGCAAKKAEDPNAGQEGVSANDAAASDIVASDYVTLGEYKGIELSTIKPTIEEKDVDIQTKMFYFSYNQPESGITDRPVALYDMTNIDYVGKKDGVAFDGGTASGAQLLIGSGQFIDGFEEGLIGVMPGETVDLNLTFPEAYHSAELAGQDVVFTVTVNYIAEMDDAVIAAMGVPNVENGADLKEYVRNMMSSQLESEYLSAVQSEVFAKVMENAQFKDFPDALLERCRADYADLLDKMAASYGMDGKTYVEANGGVYEDILNQNTEGYAKQTVLLEAIGKAENLILSDAELQARLEAYASSEGIAVDSLLQDGLTTEDYRQSFLYEDVMNFLVENANKTAQ